MQLPDDFGLSAVATFAHVGDRTHSCRHAGFWCAWEKVVSAQSPVLRGISGGGDPTDPTATHQFESVQHAAIGGVLIEPPVGTPVRAGLVSVHGYSRVGPLAGERERWEALALAGVTTLAIRVRGFAGSATGPGLLTDRPEGWITHGLDSLMAAEDAPGSVQVAAWIVPRAIADVVNAVRALRRWIGGDAPVYLHGKSLGGGLAIMAAARSRKFTPISRLVMELPSLGDWRWRLADARSDAPPRERTPASAGFHIRQLMIRHQHELDRFLSAVRLADSAVHAPEATVPVLCKLAERDEVVPAPAAAAVFNATGSDPDRKWRFVVPYGHFDGGLRNARRHALFDRVADAFLDPSREPEEGIAMFEDVLEAGEKPANTAGSSAIAARKIVEHPTLFESPAPAAPPGRPGPAPAGEFSVERVLCESYRSAGRTLDDLPYTPQFAAVASAVRAAGVVMTDRELFHKLHNLRKAGRLPRLGRSATGQTAVPAEDERLLVALIEAAVGSTGQRDQLPFTEAFDRLVWEFNQRTGRSLAAHEVWRLVATLSK